MKSSGIAYLLWCACFFGACGIHRLYLGKYGTGILYFFTFGLLGIGQFIDLFRIPGMTERENMKWQIKQGTRVHIDIHGQTGQQVPMNQAYQPREQSSQQAPHPEFSPEKALETTILKLARKFKGKLTPLELAAQSSLSLEEANKALEDLVRKGYANITVTDAGNFVYEFPGFLDFTSQKSQKLNDDENI